MIGLTLTLFHYYSVCLAFPQFGEYFGASVCAVDLNGDMLDEIVVGAPLFSENYDEGRVFVFINEEFVRM